MVREHAEAAEVIEEYGGRVMRSQCDSCQKPIAICGRVRSVTSNGLGRGKNYGMMYCAKCRDSIRSGGMKC